MEKLLSLIHTLEVSSLELPVCNLVDVSAKILGEESKLK